MKNNDPKLINLLSVVIDNYISKWEPIWSKYLHSLEGIDYAPSTLRKYLNILEKAWFVYQPYNSSWRIPTINWIAVYLDTYLEEIENKKDEIVGNISLWLWDARFDLQNIVESLGKISDWVVVGFIRNDQYFFLGINNLLVDKNIEQNFATTKKIIDFIEKREIIAFLSSKIIKSKQIYYSFVQEDEVAFSCLYAKINIKDYEAIIAIVGPTRIDYKKNLWILKKLVELIG